MKRANTDEALSEVPAAAYIVTTNFSSTTAKNILDAKPKRPLVILDEKTLLFDAVEKMSYEKVVSLPVMKAGQFVGFLDVLDVLKHAVSLFDPQDINITLEELDQKSEKYTETLVTSLLPPTTDVSSLVIPIDMPLPQILKKLKTHGIHRVLVFPKDFDLTTSKPEGIITQSDVIKLLYHNNHLLDQVTLLPLQETTVPKPVKITVPIEMKLHAAFTTMIENNISGIAVTSTHKISQKDGEEKTVNKLFCNLSASDIRGLGVLCPFKALSLPVDKFFLQFRDNVRPPVVCHLNNWLVLAISKMVLFGIHRIWVCDEHEQVTHVVTMTDVMEYLYQVLEENVF